MSAKKNKMYVASTLFKNRFAAVANAAKRPISQSSVSTRSRQNNIRAVVDESSNEDI